MGSAIFVAGAISIFWIVSTVLGFVLVKKWRSGWNRRRQIIVLSAIAPTAILLPIVASVSFQMLPSWHAESDVLDNLLGSIPGLVGAFVVLGFGVLAIAILAAINYFIIQFFLKSE